MSLRNQLMASATALLAAFNPISNAQAMDDAATVAYRGPLLKQIDAAEGGDGLASVAAAGLMLKFEEASKGDLSKPKTVQDSRDKYWFGAAVGAEKIVVCGATLKEDGSGIGPGFVRSEITTSNGAVKTEKINSDCRSVLKAAYDSMIKSIGESSSDGRVKQNTPE